MSTGRGLRLGFVLRQRESLARRLLFRVHYPRVANLFNDTLLSQ
jgi:hypothetical protein